MSAADIFTWKVDSADTWLFILQVSAIATICLAAFTLIYSVVRLIVGKKCALDWIAPLIWLAASAVFVAACYMWDKDVSGIGVAGWLAAAVSVPAFIIGLVPGKKAGKAEAVAVKPEASGENK